MNFIQVNKLIMKAINSQDKNVFCEVMDTLMNAGVTGLFVKKRYLWNIIRPRDIYKLMTYWIEINIKDEKIGQRINIMHELLLNTKDIKIRKSFVWGLMKRVNLLTIYTIEYTSEEKIKNIVGKLGIPDQDVYADNILLPLLVSVREQFDLYKAEIEVLNSMIDL